VGWNFAPHAQAATESNTGHRPSTLGGGVPLAHLPASGMTPLSTLINSHSPAHQTLTFNPQDLSTLTINPQGFLNLQSSRLFYLDHQPSRFP